MVLRRGQDLRFGRAGSRASPDFYGPAVSRKTSEAQQTPPDAAFLDDWLARCGELVDKYRPQLVWFDWWIAQPAVHPYLQKFAAFYYNRGAEWKTGVAINYKKHGGESFPDTAGVLDVERGQLAGMRTLFWQTDTSVSKNSWGYIEDHQYKTSDALIDDLVDIVSKNGALLLNIGPKPDGTIPEPEQRILREIGQWLTVNGEAIYGTRPWTTFGEGPTAVVEGPFADTKRAAFTGQDIRFTRKGDTRVRDRAGVAGVRHRVDQGVGGERAGGDPRDCGGRGPRRPRRRQVDAGRRGPSPSGGRAADPGAGGGGVSHQLPLTDRATVRPGYGAGCSIMDGCPSHARRRSRGPYCGGPSARGVARAVRRRDWGIGRSWPCGAARQPLSSPRRRCSCWSSGQP